MPLLVFIRTDASQKIGSGHVMRCLTLAEELRNSGAIIEFITRIHLGNLNQQIKSKGFKLHLLPTSKEIIAPQNLIEYEQWLGVKQKTDAEDTIQLLSGKKLDWLIIDHYALDKVWEDKLRPYTDKIMVIDDLANRSHNCEILLDQTYGRNRSDYIKWVNNSCKIVLGSNNSLIRPEFSKLRMRALKHREKYNTIKNIMVSMGSMDEKNITLRVLNAISSVNWQIPPEVNIVLTSGAPHLQKIRENVTKYDFKVQLLIDVTNMAELMMRSDLAIGGGGTTSWERCTVALPTVLIILAENQQKVGENLAESGAVIMLQDNNLMEDNVRQAIISVIQDKIRYIKMSKNASKVCDGLGAQRVVNEMLSVDIGKK